MSKIEPRVKAVFDCMIYLQGVARPKGPANACFALVREGVTQLYLSTETLAEIEDVLTRPKFRGRFPSLTDEMIDEFLSELKELAIILTKVSSAVKFSRDPKDEKYLNLAVDAEAGYIVSRDKDLLDLMTDYTDEAKEFRQRFGRLKIVGPVDFLRMIRIKELPLKP